MAKRIPQHFIDELLARTDIVDVIDSYVPLKKSGKNYKACCPFHSEKTPSFTVSQEKQFFHCFGCGVNGSAIGFLMDYDHMEFTEAIEHLAKLAGLDVPTENHKHNNIQKGIDLYQLMSDISRYYQQQLRSHPQKNTVINYLKQRGLSGEVAKRFDIGFAEDAWDSLIKQFGQTPQAKKALLNVGLLSEKNNKLYNRFRNRVMFPIHDHRGRVVGFGGRTLSEDYGPKYLNSPETSIFHKGSELYGLYAARAAIKQQDMTLVVEGYMDVMALNQANIGYCVATLGTATTATHLQRLFRYTQNICFCFDGDRAGHDAAWKALQVVLPQLKDGHQISFLFLPDGEDPDSMVRKIGNDDFTQLIHQATSLPDYLINTLSQGIDLTRLDGKAKLTELARPMLKQISEGILKKLIVSQLAQKTRIAEHELSQTTASQTPNKNNFVQAKAKTPKTLGMTTVRRILSLLLQQPKLAIGIKHDALHNAEQVHGIALLKQLIEQIKQTNGDITTGGLLEKHRHHTHFHALEHLATYNHHLSEEHVNDALERLIQKLKLEENEAKLDQLIEKEKSQELDNEEKEMLRKLLNISQHSSHSG